MPTLQVTVLSGFLGAGKSTLLNHLIRNPGDRRLAVLVNDMAELNFDAVRLKSGRTILDSDRLLAPDSLVELHNGCICCTLRDEFVREVAILAGEGRFDHLIVEATGVAEPLPIAMVFDQETQTGESLSAVAHLDSMLTVVDAKNFLSDWDAAGDLVSLGLAVDGVDNRTLADLLAEQVEFANQIIINKTDLVSREEVARLCRILECLNPEAEIHTTMFGVVDTDAILGTGLYDASQMTPPHEAEPAIHEALGITSFVFRARRPFHPERLWACLHEAWPGVMRSKGLFWLASRMNDSGLWSQAGAACSHQGAGRWWGSISEDLWPDDYTIQESIRADFRGPFGDRRQEIVLIGQNLDQAAITARLESCLLDASEMQMGPMGWRQLEDPFPTWEEAEDDATDLSLPPRRRQIPTA